VYAKARTGIRRVRKRVKRSMKGPVPLPAKMALGLGLGVPVVANALSGAKAFFAPNYGELASQARHTDLWGRASVALGCAADDFTRGWGFGEVFNSVPVVAYDDAGVPRGMTGIATGTFRTMPSGGSLILGTTAAAAAGLSLGLSWVARKVTGRKSVKIAGQTIA